ncbi:hypothetical protein GGI20_005844 [Coemansia sp. BCRC 34301]|nr:hypothetical protein GGI20_005844 [Coemansia sp. BCRC 34301]
MLDVGRQPTADQRRNVRAAAQFAQAAGGTGSDKEPQSDVSSHGLGSLFMDSLPVLDASRIGNSNKAAGATPPPAFHALSRILNSSGHTPRSAASPYSSTQNSTAYVPFQDPTVDISTLPKYQDVDLKQQRQGSTRQVGPPPGSAMSNLYSATPSEIRDVTSAHGSFAFRSQNGRCLSPWSRVQPHKYDDSDMVATVRYDSPSPPTGPLTASLESLSLSDIDMEEEEATSIGHSARRKYSSGSAKEGPTLRDIYNLLKKTVTSIDAQQQKEEDVSMHVVPRQLQSQTPEYRPTAPTPRRSRHFPSQYRDASSDSDSESRMLRGRSDTGQSRVRAYLQRYISESAASHPPPPPPPAEGAEKMLADILSFVSGDGQIDADLRAVLSRKLPPALADKLRELAGVLAQATTAKEECKTPAAVANEAVQTDDCVQPMADKEDAGLRLELLRLQRDILAKFDEYRAEVDQLRCEVRRASSSPSVAPHDSVSVAGRVTSPPATPTKQPSRVGDRVHDWRAETVDDDSQSETSTTVPGVVSRSPVDAFTAMGSRRTRHTAVSPWDGHSDLLATREALDAIRAKQGADDGFARHMYGREVAQQLAATLAELQRVHVAQFHGPRSASPCAVCRALEAQNHDPYLFGRRAVAYRSLTTRQLQGLLNAYVAAMQDHQEEQPQTVKARMSYTPTRAKAARSDVPPAEPQASKVVGLLRDELDALSRRYHRLVDEFRRLDPSRESDQRRRKQMSRELKDLVDVLDVKGEQIAILAQLHPEVTTRASSPSPSPAKASKPGLSSTQRALQSARELQSALGDLY